MPRRGTSRQKSHGGGKWASESQRKWAWANVPKAAKKWAHNRKTSKSDWAGRSSGRKRKKS